jgi:hypothetical protein
MSRNEDFKEFVNKRDWFHGTDEAGQESIELRGARTDFRGIAVHGPGFHLTPDKEQAENYAEEAADRTYNAPKVVYGRVNAQNPIEVTHNQLERLGRQFRSNHPNLSPLIHDAAAGNIALRQRGHDFMHVTENGAGDPIDVGVVLRPHAFEAQGDPDIYRHIFHAAHDDRISAAARGEDTSKYDTRIAFAGEAIAAHNRRNARVDELQQKLEEGR